MLADKDNVVRVPITLDIVNCINMHTMTIRPNTSKFIIEMNMTRWCELICTPYQSADQNRELTISTQTHARRTDDDIY